MKINRLHIANLTSSDKRIIDQFVEHNNGLVFHETKFNEIVTQIYKTRCFYFLAYINNELVGVCPAHILREGLLKFIFSSMPFHEIPYGGWIYDDTKTSIVQLLKKSKVKFTECLFYSSSIKSGKNDFEQLGIPNLKIFKTIILDLSPSVDDLFNQHLTAKQRNKIRRAQKVGITIEQITLSNITEFNKLSYELKQRIGLATANFDFYKQVMEVYSVDNKAVCLAAKYENQYISSMILVSNTNYTIAWVAGRKNNLPNNLYQNELLWWESILWAKKSGSNYFDLCGLDEEKLPHLARIKLSFSKEIIPFYAFCKKSLFFRFCHRLQKVYIKITSRR